MLPTVFQPPFGELPDCGGSSLGERLYKAKRWSRRRREGLHLHRCGRWETHKHIAFGLDANRSAEFSSPFAAGKRKPDPDGGNCSRKCTVKLQNAVNVCVCAACNVVGRVFLSFYRSRWKCKAPLDQTVQIRDSALKKLNCGTSPDKDGRNFADCYFTDFVLRCVLCVELNGKGLL